MIVPDELAQLMTTRPNLDRTIGPGDHVRGVDMDARREALANLAATRMRARLRGDEHLVRLCDERAHKIAYPARPWDNGGR